MWRNGNLHTPLAGPYNSAVTSESSQAAPQTVKHRATARTHRFHPQVYTQEKWKHTSSQNSHMNVHSSTTHGSKMVAMTHTSIDSWIDKQNVFPYNEISCSKNKTKQNKKRNTDTSYNMDEPWAHYVKWRETVTKDHTPQAFIYRKCPEQAK